MGRQVTQCSLGLPNYLEYPTEEISFCLAFGTDAILPVEIGMPSYKTEYFDEAENTYLIAYSLDLMAKKKKMS